MVAASYIDSIEARAPPWADQQKVIWEKTSQEVLAKFMDPPVSRAAMDVRWGRNLWRPVVRFAVEERSGKFRVIDNGRSGGHNSCTSASERILHVQQLGGSGHCPTCGCLVCDASPW